MNALDRLLDRELTALLDRVAADSPPGAVSAIEDTWDGGAEEIARADGRLAELRLSLLETYAAWQAALEEYEGLRGLASMRARTTEAASVPRAA
jgi:hypothetical protein